MREFVESHLRFYWPGAPFPSEFQNDLQIRFRLALNPDILFGSGTSKLIKSVYNDIGNLV